MDFSYEEVNPTLIANTTMQLRLLDGNPHGYRITPNAGYVLHDKALDAYNDYTEDGEGIGDVILGFTTGTCTCAASYDFTENLREFYAVPESTVPADQIFGGGNDHEIA